MNTSASGLTSRQERAIAALLTEVSHEAAAKAAGVSITTLWRWQKEPHFRRECLAARRQIVEEAVGLAQRASKRAVATLIACLDSDNPSVQVRSAQLLIDHSMKGVELLEMEARLQEIEQALEFPKLSPYPGTHPYPNEEMERG